MTKQYTPETAKQLIKIFTVLSWLGPLVMLAAAMGFYYFVDIEPKTALVGVFIFAAIADAVVFKMMANNMQKFVDPA